MADSIYKIMVAARVRLLFENPSVGLLLTCLILMDAPDRCETVATDGRHLFYNPDFIANLPKPELVSLLTDLVVTKSPCGWAENDRSLWDW